MAPDPDFDPQPLLSLIFQVGRHRDVLAEVATDAAQLRATSGDPAIHRLADNQRKMALSWLALLELAKQVPVQPVPVPVQRRSLLVRLLAAWDAFRA